MLNAADNELLTRTGAGTPMGNLFRQFWLPVLLSSQLPAPDCAPVRVKIMGEELLAVRDSSGRVGLIEPRCPHRGANLFFGRNEHGGIRCSYHGWKFSISGECLDAPTVDLDAIDKLKSRARIKAYPACDWGDFVWAYMGPRQTAPPLPEMEFALLPPSHRYVSKKYQECNWAQAVEGGVDTAHFSFLHQPVTQSSDELQDKTARTFKGYAKGTMNHDHVRWMRDDSRPRYHVAAHDAGLILAGTRQADPGEKYWRVAQFLLPAHAYTPSAAVGQNYHSQSFIPIDDESCWVYVYTWNPDRPLTCEERASYDGGAVIYPEMDGDWMPIRNRSNDYLIDRQLQKTESFTGITGVSEQDTAIQDSQGRISDRTHELLGPTDVGVVQFRRLMLEQARALQNGMEPTAVDKPAAYYVRAGALVTDQRATFEQVMQRRFGHVHGLIAKARH